MCPKLTIQIGTVTVAEEIIISQVKNSPANKRFGKSKNPFSKGLLAVGGSMLLHPLARL
ncbi:MAG: hypothetical protein GY765_23630 [bacterium]|nr:hypothetical protein [bacterium]